MPRNRALYGLGSWLACLTCLFFIFRSMGENRSWMMLGDPASSSAWYAVEGRKPHWQYWGLLVRAPFIKLYRFSIS
ncbi:hypothetical protein GGR54DRAFT_583698 [Hypoxylon sp. NC1633]|nr:hypothetical protein GGR54DRAFT_583698 [Hypoxylon sp. NC1633]